MYMCMCVYNILLYVYLYVCIQQCMWKPGRETQISWTTVTDGHELPHGSYGSGNSTSLKTT